MPFYFLPLLILSLIACCIEVDISVPGFPDMAQYFKVDDGTIQMTVAYNFLGFCLGAALFGPLSDAYGRRPIMVWGNAILALGALGCVLAPSIPLLLWTRFFQGIGASASAVIVITMISEAYADKRKSAALVGIMNACLTVFMATAPIAGGFINEAVGWRGNYGIVAIICIISWLALTLFLPETKTTFEPFRVKKIQQDYRKLLSSETFLYAAIAPSLTYAAYLAFIAQASFLYTETFQLSLMSYVFHQAIIVFAFSVVSLLSGKLINRFGSHRCVILGNALNAFGSVSLVLMSILAPRSPYLMTLFMSILCTGSAITYPVVFTTSLELFPQIKGTASSVIMSLRSFICFAFIATTGYLYNGHPMQVSLVIFAGITLTLMLTMTLLRSKQFTCHFSPSVS